MDKLNEQYITFQTLVVEDIPKLVKENAGLQPEDPYLLWTQLKEIKKPGTNKGEFDLLFKVAEAVMTIPHSNAGEERIFFLYQQEQNSIEEFTEFRWHTFITNYCEDTH